ncbi:MAG: hypothetical protein QOG73_1011, partial [Acetobacteraceae bacterium]|nr:hypothetical protein [Acetobacteraceae bacterium]
MMIYADLLSLTITYPAMLFIQY